MNLETLESILKQLSEGLSLKKIFLWLIVAIVAMAFFAGYEKTAATIRLNRIEREIAVISKIQELQRQETNAPPEIIQARSFVYTQALQVFKEEPSWPVLRFVLYAFIAAATLGIILFLLLVTFVFVTNFQAARKKSKANACINNLRQIDAAKLQWALENGKSLNDTPTEQDLKNYLKGNNFPKCPCGNPYKINALSLNPACGEDGHTLEAVKSDDHTANPLPGGIADLLRAFLAASDKAHSINCINNLKQVGLAARIWSHSHSNKLPPDFAAMKTELHSDKITHCSDNESAEYVILSPHALLSEPSVVFAKCPLHNHVVLVDGSVHTLGKQSLIQKDGKWVLQ